MAAAGGAGRGGGKGGGGKGEGSLAYRAWRLYLLQLQQHPLRTKVPSFVLVLGFCSNLSGEAEFLLLNWVGLADADDHGGVPRRRQRLRGAEAVRAPED